MRRGSLMATYAIEGRRNSSHMAQLEISNNQTVDNIKYNREGGCFVSNKKFAICFLLFLVCISGAGFVGHRFAFSPKTKVHDPLDLLALEESEENNNSDSKFSLSQFVLPLRYHIILTPIFQMNRVSRIKGHIIIEFRQDSAKSLNRFVLNAQNINPLSYRLTREMHSKNEKKREVKEENDYEISAVTETDSIASMDHTTMQDYVDNVSYKQDEESTSVTPDTTTNEHKLLKLEEWSTKSFVEKTTSENKEEENGTDVGRKLKIDSRNETLNEIGISNYEVNEANKVHIINLLTPIERGNYSLEIEYDVTFNNSSLTVTNFTRDGKNRWLMATQVKPTFARRLFPVFDDMNFKAHFSLSVSRPKDMKILSNMPLKISEDSSDGQVIDTFEETPLISPHNLAFIEGNIETIVKTNYGDGENSSTITFWGDATRSSQITYLSDKIDAVLDKFVNLFSITYPMKKMDLIGHPMMLDGTGSPGLISIKEQLFYLQEESSSVVLKIEAVKNLIHQVGRQWLGGVINTQNWTDTWLLEGSLIYFSHAFLKEIDPSFETSGSFESDVQWKMMDRDAYSVSRSLQHKIHATHLDDFGVDQHYKKGACLIRMLHGLLNDTAFRSGYENFARRWAYGNGNLNSFWEAMSENIENQTENLKLIDIMNTWIYQSGYPVVSVRRNKTGSININQAWFAFDNMSSQKEKLWYIPLTFTNSSDNWNSPTHMLMTKKEILIENLAVDNWIVFNINGEGYYRVNYDINNWMYLAEALKENPDQFPPATRASLIDDVLSLAQGGLTSYKIAFKLINYMRTKEKHYAPWAALSTHLLKLKFSLYNTDIYSDFQIFTRQFLSVIYNETESTNDDGSQLSVVIKKLACNFEHPHCIDWARKLFAIIKNSNGISLPLHTREIFYCAVARVGGEDEWQYFLQKAINATDKEEKNRILSSLACFQVPWILQKILKMTLDENLFSEEESRLILHSFSRNPEAAFAVQRFIERSWPDITKRYQKSYFMMKEFILAMTKSLMTKQDLVMFQEFRDNNIKTLKAVGYDVVLAEVESSSWEQWRNVSLPVIEMIIKFFVF
ncbi:thyrotropin-releasing hormone-degrading ectoenzyme-like isoform X1 [Leptopilina heterotoma]|uniref:thyrotropin-releasing hormone-degrading ectoenzyme-like isoform X1 n=1 Tax=Leptopilina heterotoma TaxID=63436 RepID=UPI001CA8C2D8|nr:thyrotropin-releasing hormone-degrading ectoenzyme-like isoform X1 [Leptopilina heterotoma]